MGIETVLGLIVAAGIAVWMYSRERHWRAPCDGVEMTDAEIDEKCAEVERRLSARARQTLR